MIKTILFDVDGVLAIGEPWNKKLAQSYGITENMLKPFFAGPFQACLVGKTDLKDTLAPYLAQWNWPHSTEDFLAYWFRQEQAVNEPLLQVVQQYRQRGLTCYLATQQERYRTTYILRDMGFADQFDGMFSSVDVGFMKTDPAFFETLLRELDGYQPAEVLFWDDTPKNVATAQRVGIQAEVYSDFAGFIDRMRAYGIA